MRRFFVFLGVVLTTIGSVVRAQEVDSIAPLQKSSWGDAKTNGIIDYIPDISFDTRFGYGQYFPDERGRFGGDGLYLNINGYISPHFSYSLQQRLASTYYEENDGFNGTNWLTLTYEVGDFEFTVGKDGLLVGSFEYDRDDMDSYFDMNSMFYNMFESWQWGIYATWYPADNHSITFQAAQSPFVDEDVNMFSYAAAWRMETDIYESYWSANLWEYMPGRFVTSINLGNMFRFGDFSTSLDYQTRGTGDKSMFTDDFTVSVRPEYELGKWGCAFAKIGLEKVDTDIPYELAYEGCRGTEFLFYGAGIEFFPLMENRDIRLHAVWAGNSAGGNYLNVGIRWNFNLTAASKQLFSKLSK